MFPLYHSTHPARDASTSRAPATGQRRQPGRGQNQTSPRRHGSHTCVDQQVSEVLPFDLQRSKDPQNQGGSSHHVHQHGEGQSQFTVGEAVTQRHRQSLDTRRDGGREGWERQGCGWETFHSYFNNHVKGEGLISPLLQCLKQNLHNIHTGTQRYSFIFCVLLTKFLYSHKDRDFFPSQVSEQVRQLEDKTSKHCGQNCSRTGFFFI